LTELDSPPIPNRVALDDMGRRKLLVTFSGLRLTLAFDLA